MPSRSVDKHLDELTARYDLSAAFTARLRPMLASVLSDALGDDRRVALLEEVAATCQREQILQRDLVALRAALHDVVQGVARLRQRDPGSW